MQSFVPKARRPRFELYLKISDLNNVPLVSGNCFIKWHLPASTAADHRGRTPKCAIKDHKVVFDYEKQLPVRLVIGKDQMLQEAWIDFEVLQEYSSAGKGERIALGTIRLNLSEYVEPSENSHHSEEGVTRRYLMQDSKINSTLKIGIHLKHIEGDRNYYAPPLRTAAVFGGIAGIMSQEATEAVEEGHVPSLSNKSRETGEMQDMYRRTLAASWVAQPGELRADDCIRDIFAGGDGWGSHLDHVQDARNLGGDDAKWTGGNSANLTPAHHHNWSPRHKFGIHDHHRHTGKDSSERRKALDGWGKDTGLGKHGTFGGRTSLHQQAKKHEMASLQQQKQKPATEIEEFNNPYREDRASWKVGRSTMI